MGAQPAVTCASLGTGCWGMEGFLYSTLDDCIKWKKSTDCNFECSMFGMSSCGASDCTIQYDGRYRFECCCV